MLAPTHIAFGSIIAFSLGATPTQAIFVIIGSLLPDSDTTKSIIGRLFPWSWLLNSYFGHRGFIHSLTLWLPLLIVGYWLPLFGWLVTGAISHIMLDTLNISGVHLFYPSHRLAVFGGRNMRFSVGSSIEMVFFVCLSITAYGTYWIQSNGGWRNLVGLIGSYEIASKTAIKSGLHGVIIQGKWRKTGGEVIENYSFLVIGKEGKGKEIKLALWDEQTKRIVRAYKHIYPLHVRAYKQEWQWQTHYSSIPMEATGDIFYKPNNKWGYAQTGNTVIGLFKWYYSDE